MGYRILAAIDQFDTRHAPLMFAAGLADGGDIHVLHVIEHYRSRLGSPATLETYDEAAALVEEAAFDLQMSGLRAEGHTRRAPAEHVAHVIADEADRLGVGVIVVGSRRLRGWQRIYNRGVREQLLRHTDLPVVVAPAPVDTRRNPAPHDVVIPGA